jgi:hypothetical protein
MVRRRPAVHFPTEKTAPDLLAGLGVSEGGCQATGRRAVDRTSCGALIRQSYIGSLPGTDHGHLILFLISACGMDLSARQAFDTGMTRLLRPTLSRQPKLLARPGYYRMVRLGDILPFV